MLLSDQLAEAARIPIVVGQYVAVRTARGDQLVAGYVEDVDAERGLVHVRDTDQGVDVTYVVDTKRYTLWVETPKNWVGAETSVVVT